MAARAVFTEAATNVTSIDAMTTQNVSIGPLSDRIWLQELHDIAALLSSAELGTAQRAYMWVSQCETIRLRSLKAKKLDDEDRKFLEHSRENFREAVDILRKRGYGIDELP